MEMFEIRFHGKLYDITGNKTLKQFQKMLLPIFDYVHNSGLLKMQPLLKTFVSHRRLVEILDNGTPEEFRIGMRSHLENHFARSSTAPTLPCGTGHADLRIGQLLVFRGGFAL